jgi:hypothetical protein
MTPPVEGRRYRRLVLDLHHDIVDRYVVRAAAELATLLKVDLHGFFIEDEAVLSLAALPFAREFRLPAYAWQAVAAADVAAELHRTSEAMQRVFEEVTKRIGAAGLFEIRRGDAATCLDGCIEASDILVIAEARGARARITQSFARRTGVALGGRATVMLLPSKQSRLTGPIAVVVTRPGDVGLELAVRLALDTGQKLFVLVPQEYSRALVDSIQGRASENALSEERLEILKAAGLDQDAILATLGRRTPSLLVVPREVLKDGENASHLATALGAPVLVQAD